MSNKTNRLAKQVSPYLLQHANNPVDWYPWGEEAFEKAKGADKPIFLSIGYSTCHWCHVMAHESFESEEVAKLLNSSFISIKVDREERPDIDEVYMNVCQAMTGSGGWPLTIFMTADKKPFYAGTYFPKITMYGRMGITELLSKISKIWKTDRQSLLQNSEKIRSFFTQSENEHNAKLDADKIIEKGYRHIESSFDKQYGGFSHSPKFPTPHYLLFLLKYSKAHKSKDALAMAEQTLDHMYRGGIFDHVGYGFSRYSTDHKWLVPHFEKMLYDNAMLLLTYCECYSATANPKYRDIIIKICTYLLRDMLSPDGGFYSAEDADSQGEEGKFYVFDYQELNSRFSQKEMLFLEEHYGVSKQGNFEGKNILNKISGGAQESELNDSVIAKLYEIRQKRVRPFLDTKISASWNGLMIEALIRAGVILRNLEYIESAKKAADFILQKMMGNSELFGIYKDGTRSSTGFLADYANIINALLAVYSATLEIKYLQKANSLAENMIALFWEKQEDRFYMAKKADEELFLRPKDEYDGAMPSGNASAIMCLTKLVNLTGNETFAQTLDSAIAAFADKSNTSPGSHVHFLSSLLIKSQPHRQIVLVSDKDNAQTLNTYQEITRSFLPFSTVIYYDKSSEMQTLFPELKQYKTTAPFAAYICENFACKSPVYSHEDLLNELNLKID